jgi:RNA-directed DNA polymerase
VAIPAEQDKVRELQRTLYRAAKADSQRRFHVLYDKVHRRDVLERAWELVRANRGAAGIDKQTIADVEEYGIATLLDGLAADLKRRRVATAPAPQGVHPEARQADTTLSRYSLTSRGGVRGGLRNRTSRTVLRRSRIPG